MIKMLICSSWFCLPHPKPQVVSTQVKAPERKELPLIDGQVPKDAGVEGMHPIDFKAFWEAEPFQVFCQLVQFFQSVFMGFKRLSHVDSLIRSYGLFVFCCHETVRSLDFFWYVMVCPSLGISKIWLWSTCAVKTAASGHIAGTVHVPAMDSPQGDPEICGDVFRTSPSWPSCANTRHIGLRQRLDGL